MHYIYQFWLTNSVNGGKVWEQHDHSKQVKIERRLWCDLLQWIRQAGEQQKMHNA